MGRLFSLVAMLWLAMAQVAASDTYLLMAEEDGCMWCARWTAEIGPIYPKTPEGQAAPLRTYDIRVTPGDVIFASRVRFTPTFILVQDGVERGRIEGYPGDEMFWWMLTSLFERANLPGSEGAGL